MEKKCSCIDCPIHIGSHSVSMNNSPHADTRPRRPNSRGQFESDEDSSSGRSQKSYSLPPGKEMAVAKDSEEKRQSYQDKDSEGGGNQGPCTLLSGSETEWESSESSGESRLSVSLLSGTDTPYSKKDDDENESSINPEVADSETSSAQNSENDEETKDQDAKDEANCSEKRKCVTKGPDGWYRFHWSAKKPKTEEKKREEAGPSRVPGPVTDNDDDDESWKKDFWKDAEYEMGLGDLFAMNLFPQDYVQNRDEPC